MRSILLYSILFLTVSASAQKTVAEVLDQYNAKTIPYISVEELRMLQLNDNVVILDSREMREFEVSKIPSAMYVGYSEFSSEEVSEAIPNKDKTVVVYCSLGVRSETIGEKLKKAGFTNVKNLFGGIIEWKNKGYPVYDPQGNETEKVHTSSKYWSQWLKRGKKVY